MPTSHRGQADTEVSEAIDFARWYARSTRRLDDAAAVPRPRGVVVVTPPWNFPYAIPAGGMLGRDRGRQRGDPQTRARGRRDRRAAPRAPPGRRCPHRRRPVPPRGRRRCREAAGHPPRRRGRHPDRRRRHAPTFLDWAPRRRLLAETSGKNAIVVTAAADLDLAVHDVTTSAFAHAVRSARPPASSSSNGRCSTTGRFTERLVDAARTLHPGPATDPATDIAPLIRPASGWLAEALTRLEPGERWELPPRRPRR